MVCVCCAYESRLMLNWMLSSVTFPFSFWDRPSLSLSWELTGGAELLVWQAIGIFLSASQQLGCRHGATTPGFLPVGLTIGSPMLEWQALYQLSHFLSWPFGFLYDHLLSGLSIFYCKISMCCQKYSLDYNFKFPFCECFVSLLFKAYTWRHSFLFRLPFTLIYL